LDQQGVIFELLLNFGAGVLTMNAREPRAISLRIAFAVPAPNTSGSALEFPLSLLPVMTKSPTSRLLPRRDFCLSALAGLGAGSLLAGELFAQAQPKPAPPKPAPPKPATPRPAPRGAKKDDANEPKPVTLETKDGVSLKAVYYPGKGGKETVPVIMLHGWEERGVVWEPLAVYFQRTLGHSVIVPDLRGHGQSLTQTAGARARQLKPDDLTPVDMDAMAWDVHACKKYLQEENNKGELNIEMLTVIGAEYGALVALKFAALDWSWPALTTGKQGQDVKAIAMLTPIDRFKRVSAAEAIQSLRPPILGGRFSTLIIAGQQDRGGISDAKRLHKQMENLYPNDQKEAGCWLVTPETGAHGVQLIEPQRRLGTEQILANFIKQRIIDRKSEFEWAERKSALQR
jgi:pimeloyl-ACP methyl ester carboxylesterase